MLIQWKIRYDITIIYIGINFLIKYFLYCFHVSFLLYTKWIKWRKYFTSIYVMVPQRNKRNFHFIVWKDQLKIEIMNINHEI